MATKGSWVDARKLIKEDSALITSFYLTVKKIMVTAAAGAVALTSFMTADVSAQAFGQTQSQQGRDGGQYIPTIWVDPDGCEHWVMDDGFEGFMTPHVTRDGKPVARIVPITQRRPGLLKVQIGMAPDFDAMPEWLVDTFEGSASDETLVNI